LAAKSPQKSLLWVASGERWASEIVLKAAVYEVGTDRKEGGAVKLATSLLGGKFGFNVSGNVLDGVSVKLAFGGIDAVLSALDADSRFRSIPGPG
jgi:hypothetical protein